MTTTATVTSSHSRGPTEVINARRTESVDAPAILQLFAERTSAQFGRVDIVQLIEKANLSVTLSNEENEVLGFAGFLDFPQIEVCDQSLWENWMRENNYSVSNLATPLNSLFLHYFVAKGDYTIGCASEIVSTVFNAVPELRFIFMVLKLDVKPEPALAEIFHPDEKDSTPGHHMLYVCHRHDHVPLLHIRKAVVEDHDDLTPLFKRLNNTLTEDYGNYFLAEMVEAQDQDNHSVVAEVGGKAVGFLSICSQVNVPLLEECFELDSFHGLRKPHPDDITEPPKPPTPPPVEEITEPAPVEPPQSEHSLYSTSGSEKPMSRDGRTSSSIATAAELEPATSELSVAVATENSSSTATVRAKLSEERVGEEEEVFLREEKSGSAEEKGEFRPTYAGELNAFSIQLFAIDERYEMRSSDFLPEIFKLFPDKDFAVITVPHLVPEFPLLQQFVRVTPRPTSNAPHELYVFHRHGLISSAFKVRPACTSDYDAVVALTKNIKLQEYLLSDLELFNSARRDADGTEIQAYVADCLGQVVGICITRREENIEHVRSHYNVEDFIYFSHYRRDEHAHLHHFALNPVFQHYSKHFMKEVLRQGHKSCIYYPIYPNNMQPENVKKHSLITALNFLVPVKARRQIVYPLDELEINAPSERVVAKLPPYALNHINRKLTLEPKVTINARIVVVGASDVGVSFLESLCFCPHLRFNNLTLVSKRGIPARIKSNARSYSADDLAAVSLASWVNVVHGMMTAIDRSRRQVVMEDGSKVNYDHLVLCTGQQYMVPCPTGADVSNMATNHDLPKGAINRPLDENLPCPENAMALNDVTDEEKLTSWASKLASSVEETDGMVVVYGRNFESYLAVQTLLTSGLEGSRIALVRPPVQNSTISQCEDGCSSDAFNEPAVSAHVERTLEVAGVQVLDDHVIASWEVEGTPTGTRIVALDFTTPTRPLTSLPCAGLVSLHPRRIIPRTFAATNDACLVFDGRLSIDAAFRTNDPRIRAAGPLTKYARKYHADGFAYRHENFSSKEIGFRVAMTILPLFDPTLDGGRESVVPPTPAPSVTDAPLFLGENPNERLVPVYQEPKVTFGEIPGGLQYLHVRKPGERPFYSAQIDNPDHGRELVTGSPVTGDYFRLHVNQYERVETVTCLSQGELPVGNLARLFGLHERYLNGLLARFDEGLVPDLFAFFREPWTMAVFHDRFQDFRQEVRDIVSSAPKGAPNIPSLEARVRQLVDEDLVVNGQQRAELRREYESLGLKKEVEGRLLSYLSYNYYHLPMYAKPGMI